MLRERDAGIQSHRPLHADQKQARQLTIPVLGSLGARRKQANRDRQVAGDLFTETANGVKMYSPMDEPAESMRARIAEMNEFELLRRGRTAAILLASFSDGGYRVELEHLRAEWRRRPAGRRPPTKPAEPGTDADAE